MLLASLAMIWSGVGDACGARALNQTMYRVLLLWLDCPPWGWPTRCSTLWMGDQFQATKKRVNATTIQRLKDIRAAQESHLSVYGTFAESFDSLIQFVQSLWFRGVQHGVVPRHLARGQKPRGRAC